jgi:hypothetical protein
MAHFAKIENNIVTQVVVAKQDFIDTLPDSDAWLQTSYNTRGGIHHEPNSNTPSADQSKALRKNFAGIGYTYDQERDAFIAPKPREDCIFDEWSCTWLFPEDSEGNA